MSYIAPRHLMHEAQEPRALNLIEANGVNAMEALIRGAQDLIKQAEAEQVRNIDDLADQSCALLIGTLTDLTSDMQATVTMITERPALEQYGAA